MQTGDAMSDKQIASAIVGGTLGAVTQKPVSCGPITGQIVSQVTSEAAKAVKNGSGLAGAAGAGAAVVGANVTAAGAAVTSAATAATATVGSAVAAVGSTAVAGAAALGAVAVAAAPFAIVGALGFGLYKALKK